MTIMRLFVIEGRVDSAGERREKKGEKKTKLGFSFNLGESHWFNLIIEYRPFSAESVQMVFYETNFLAAVSSTSQINDPTLRKKKKKEKKNSLIG